MANWVIITIIILAFAIYAKTTNFRYSNIVSYGIAGMLAFFTFTFIWVVMSAGLADSLGTYDGFVQGVRLYAAWISTVGSTGASITGNAIQTLSQNVSEIAVQP